MTPKRERINERRKRKRYKKIISLQTDDGRGKFVRGREGMTRKSIMGKEVKKEK